MISSLMHFLRIRHFQLLSRKCVRFSQWRENRVLVSQSTVTFHVAQCVFLSRSSWHIVLKRDFIDGSVCGENMVSVSAAFSFSGKPKWLRIEQKFRYLSSFFPSVVRNNRGQRILAWSILTDFKNLQDPERNCNNLRVKFK